MEIRKWTVEEIQGLIKYITEETLEAFKMLEEELPYGNSVEITITIKQK